MKRLLLTCLAGLLFSGGAHAAGFEARPAAPASAPASVAMPLERIDAATRP